MAGAIKTYFPKKSVHHKHRQGRDNKMRQSYGEGPNYRYQQGHEYRQDSEGSQGYQGPPYVLPPSRFNFEANQRAAWSEAEIIIFSKLARGKHPVDLEDSIAWEMRRRSPAGYRLLFLRSCSIIMANLRAANKFAGLVSFDQYQGFSRGRADYLNFKLEMHHRFFNYEGMRGIYTGAEVEVEIGRSRVLDRDAEVKLEELRNAEREAQRQNFRETEATLRSLQGEVTTANRRASDAEAALKDAELQRVRADLADANFRAESAEAQLVMNEQGSTNGSSKNYSAVPEYDIPVELDANEAVHSVNGGNRPRRSFHFSVEPEYDMPAELDANEAESLLNGGIEERSSAPYLHRPAKQSLWECNDSRYETTRGRSASSCSSVHEDGVYDMKPLSSFIPRDDTRPSGPREQPFAPMMSGATPYPPSDCGAGSSRYSNFENDRARPRGARPERVQPNVYNMDDMSSALDHSSRRRRSELEPAIPSLVHRSRAIPRSGYNSSSNSYADLRGPRRRTSLSSSNGGNSTVPPSYQEFDSNAYIAPDGRTRGVSNGSFQPTNSRPEPARPVPRDFDGGAHRGVYFTGPSSTNSAPSYASSTETVQQGRGAEHVRDSNGGDDGRDEYRYWHRRGY
ncbi:hypothetical protein BJ875DRAFT_498980 [Amylocarpus encephaloides]|uniref:Uncharacterized protein n=1 Tax=Amylocarpus encephaloides TaxID=45428 RepID=A0A9P7YC75_9HELO|nr:hypothetical protein BJ875DRAFT_498980 [Amylocarpus encephaloides]